MSNRTRLTLAAAALVIVQVVHGAVPAETEGGSIVGPIVGLIFIIAGITAVAGNLRGREWARTLTGVTGLAVAIGFLLYHALPFHNALTNPYFGEDTIGLAQWAPVIACIAIGLWSAYEAFWTERTFRSATPA